MSAYEVNFDGLVGPTHNYAGLSFGNVASTKNKAAVANPLKAALQGLDKMKSLSDLGLKQAVLPPQERPHIPTLRKLGFEGDDKSVLACAAKLAPELLRNVSSASSMWVANAATVSPSVDTLDGRLHLSVANLNNKFHRSIEAPTTGAALRAIFSEPDYFVVHDALPQQSLWGDEGAANHNRFSARHGERGIEVFVYGEKRLGGKLKPARFPARQTLEASQAIARRHGLSDELIVYVQQNPHVIDQGVFHNDVISVSNGPVWFYHEEAFVNTQASFDLLRQKLNDIGCEFEPIMVPKSLVSVEDAVHTYLFNSQLVTKPDGKMMLVLPQEVEENTRVKNYLDGLIASDGTIDEMRIFDLRESMKNGGGPACLRLRVVMNESELAAANQNVFIDDALYSELVNWVKKHYRDRLHEDDLSDPLLLNECRTALDELTTIMQLGSIYDFQRN